MNIHLFGHSICRNLRQTTSITKYPNTFTDVLNKEYNKEPNTFTIWQADCISEERILYFLKKIKSIDLVIIFHQANDSSVFMPSLHNDFPIRKVDDEFFQRSHGPMEYFKHVIEDKSKVEIEMCDGNELHHAYNLYLKYMHTHDLNRNRFYGSLIQVDQYITRKKIPAIHLTYPKHLPNWFKFTSGIVDNDIAKLQDIGPYTCTHNESVNRINTEGNLYIASKINEYINQLTTVTD
jgi:hypothetical protein